MAPSRSGKKEQNLLEPLLEADIPVPAILERTMVSIDAPKIPPGELVGNPCWMWVRRVDLVEHRGGRGEFEGTLRSLERANRKRAGVARTAALVGSSNSLESRQSILKLAVLRSVERSDPNLAPICRDIQIRILDRLRVGSMHELWHNRSAHILPEAAKAKRGADLPLSDFRSIMVRLTALQETYAIVFLAARASHKRAAIRAGGYLSLTEKFEGSTHFEVAGTPEWQRLSREDLSQLVAEFSGSALERRFEVSRATISRTCKRLGISQAT